MVYAEAASCCKAVVLSVHSHSPTLTPLIRSDDDLSSFEATLPRIGSDGGHSNAYVFAYRFATIPIRIASVCRDIHASLTGPKARHRDDIDEEGLHESWDVLEKCWRDLDGLRQFGAYDIVQAEDIERFIDGWQVRCHHTCHQPFHADPQAL